MGNNKFILRTHTHLTFHRRNHSQRIRTKRRQTSSPLVADKDLVCIINRLDIAEADLGNKTIAHNMFAVPENTNADPTRMHSSRSTSTLLQASARSMVSGRKSSRRVPLGDEILIGQRTGRLYSSRSSAALTDRYISKDKLIQYSPYYAMPDVGIQNKSVLQTSRPGLSRALEKSATFPNQAPLSSRSARRHAGAFLAQSRRRDVVLSELERNRSMMLKAIEEKKLDLRRQLHATDRALRVKEQLRTRSTAEGKVVAEQTKGRKISNLLSPLGTMLLFSRDGNDRWWHAQSLDHSGGKSVGFWQ